MGDSVRRSITSHSMPSAAQVLRGLGRPVHHHAVADDRAVSSPSRTMFASPKGMVYSSSGTSPVTS